MMPKFAPTMARYKPPQQSAVSVVFADDDILVLSKPSGLLSVPGKDPAHQDCLTSRAQETFPGALITHRLDMDTSGIMVMARHKEAQRTISRQFEKREIKKDYIARIYGTPKDNAGTVDLPLICDWPRRPLQKICHEHGKQAITHWSVLARDDTTTLVDLKPLTGRSHQLRVHMQAIGHPICGDPFYANGAALSYSQRLLLHACKIGFYHPRNHEYYEFKDHLDL